MAFDREKFRREFDLEVSHVAGDAFEHAVAKHAGVERVFRAEDVVKWSREEFVKRLPELEAAKRAGRLAAGPLAGRVRDAYVRQLVGDGAPDMNEQEYAALPFAERELRAPELEAAMKARTFRPRDGGGRSLAEIDAELAAPEPADVVYEGDLERLTHGEREKLWPAIRAGRTRLVPGHRPKEAK